MSTTAEQLSKAAMTWKDAVTALGIVITLATVVVQGGRILERLDTITLAQSKLITESERARVDITKLQGADDLHAEQIRHIQTRVESMERKGK